MKHQWLDRSVPTGSIGRIASTYYKDVVVNSSIASGIIMVGVISINVTIDGMMIFLYKLVQNMLTKHATFQTTAK